jgi:DNA integrity scanning protein DisA with diadenylate cyclase activity
VDSPADLAPLHHVLGQVDGAAFFDETGALRQLGAKLLPSRESESVVEAFRGTRHTSAVRYSYDDPAALVVVVSEDGPVTVLRAGRVLGRSGTAPRAVAAFDVS